ncbi:anti-sigma factor family protein [Corynebacterium pseudopelargi]|uniref:Anti-sigma-E factor RseA n=1 Tax=Corynebacterium pseudopelargi TaxID=2080757 RepID=A0A3G6IZQ0_9CORY|nr:zf-HC2 domain-containing protein [Corynebacterium pseudopelargi]AZA09540.1 Anti-sigma-E factor RseA [Corynebacterium pseudopelargi]
MAFLEHTPNSKRFSSTDHPSPEAVAAFVDEELSSVAKHRVHVHLVHCQECRAEVERQRLASQRLRSCKQDNVQAPARLLDRLQSIATSCPEGPGAEELIQERLSLRAKFEHASKKLKYLRQEHRDH